MFCSPDAQKRAIGPVQIAFCSRLTSQRGTPALAKCHRPGALKALATAPSSEAGLASGAASGLATLMNRVTLPMLVGLLREAKARSRSPRVAVVVEQVRDRNVRQHAGRVVAPPVRQSRDVGLCGRRPSPNRQCIAKEEHIALTGRIADLLRVRVGVSQR